MNLRVIEIFWRGKYAIEGQKWRGKYTIDGRFDIVASGSMLGIHYKDVPSYPVGYVDHLDMYSMDFEEFLWANGVKESSIQDVL